VRAARVAALAVALASGVARADEDPGAPLEAERDRLLDNIARGVELPASVRRFGELARRRGELQAERARAAEAARAVEEKRRADRAAAERWQIEYTKTVDYAAGISCRFSADPRRPPDGPRSGRGAADWGPVVRKQALDLPRADVLDGEPAVLYEIAGAARRYLVEVARSSPWRDFHAERGDLVLVCDEGAWRDRRAPPEWSGPLVQSGLVARIAAAPRVVEKRRWDPVHLSSEDVRRAVYSRTWPLPPDRAALVWVFVEEEAGGGAFRARNNGGAPWTLGVPPSLPRREQVVAGHAVWAIVRGARFDSATGEMALVAEDVEAHYVDEK
jgi:hypothetical protein